jgi:hypothetical protein
MPDRESALRASAPVKVFLICATLSMLAPTSARSDLGLDEALRYLNRLEPGDYPVPPTKRLLEEGEDLVSLQPQAYSSIEYPEFRKYVESLQIALGALSDEALAARSTEADFENQQRALETLMRLSVDPKNLGIADIRETIVLAMTYDIMSGLSDAAELEPGSKTHELYSELLLAKLYNLRKIHSVWEAADATGRDLQYKPLMQVYLEAAEELKTIYDTDRACRSESARKCLQGAREVYEDQKKNLDEYLENIDGIAMQAFHDANGAALRDALNVQTRKLLDSIETLEYVYADQGIFEYEDQPYERMSPLVWLKLALGYSIEEAYGEDLSQEELNIRRARGHLDPHGTPSASNDPDVGSAATEKRYRMQQDLARLVSLQNRLLDLYSRAMNLAGRALDAFRAGENLDGHAEEAAGLYDETIDLRNEYGELAGY